MAISLLLSYPSNAQIKNVKTENVKIYGNCGMCETTIEKTGNFKNVAQIDWDKETKMATLTYDSTKTNKSEILKRIALSGYDSDEFLAPDDVYAQLPNCCKYERVNKGNAITEEASNNHKDHQHSTMENMQESNPLKTVFDEYFVLKDALVSSDGELASTSANALVNSIKTVEMTKLSPEVHNVWMKVMKDLSFDAEHIKETKNTAHQRDHFMSLSTNMYELFKVSKIDQPIYYQFCPMANKGKGANWLSKESEIKNPFYGAQMLSCGKTVETLK